MAIPTGQSAPGEMRPSTERALASRSTACSSSDEISARSICEGESGGERVAIDCDHLEVTAGGGLEQAELRGARA